ncbi:MULTISPECIES: CBS domain-containing protein [Priestia]|uniref:CBS domain-containing protein n=1 Tax=Priestia TaxID=2800373 RepID=UPI001C8DF792|nr:CBS domain-containing protein [Priestia aryabhattai]MBY0213486.1 CBS domain-containing protein [Priestia aryabhattai]MDT0148360.1 CBS domain-containing protein [Priestia aryabhattai]MDT0153774.1 CBS domain-containing protein [Priestia aryabhattai]
MNKINHEYLLSDRFEVAFNRIHDSLKKLINADTDKFTSLVRFGSNHKVVGTYRNELYQYAKLRNALVHERKELGFYIAEPHQEVVVRIEKIAEILSRPNYALSIATKKVICFEYDDQVEKVIRVLKNYPFSQYPIYKNKEYFGIVSSTAIVKWAADHLLNSILDLSDTKIGDILVYEDQQLITFAPKSINIFEVEEIFEKYHQSKRHLEAVIITENGISNEVPLGIITAWDLIELDYTID